jgi:hypothetical protein
MKKEFIEYLKTKSPEGSGKPSSYARAMEILEEILFTESLLSARDVWKFINIDNVDDLYNLVLKNQTDLAGIFKDYKPESYWKNGYCSAALKEFKELLFSKFKAYPIMKTDYKNQVFIITNTYYNSISITQDMLSSFCNELGINYELSYTNYSKCIKISLK